MLRVVIEEIPGGRMEDAIMLGVIDAVDIPGDEIGDYAVAIFEPNLPAKELTADLILDSLTDRFQIGSYDSADGWKELCFRVFEAVASIHKG